MKPTPLVSVVISTYNRARFLPQAITSVLNQTYPHFELYVADDGSTDETPDCVAAFGDRLVYLRLDHTGRPEDVRNAAIQVARGDLIAFLDDDDSWRPEKLARQVAAFAQDEALGLVYTDVQLLFPDGSVSEAVLKPQHRRPAAVFDALVAECFIHPSTVVLRRRLFDQVGPFSQRFQNQSDYHFWLCATHAAPALGIPDPLVLVRKHESSLATRYGLVNYENAILVLESLPATLRLTAGQRLLRRRALARHYTHAGLHHLHSGNLRRARPLFLRSVRLNPLQRRAWSALAQSLATSRRV